MIIFQCLTGVCLLQQCELSTTLAKTKRQLITFHEDDADMLEDISL